MQKKLRGINFSTIIAGHRVTANTNNIDCDKFHGTDIDGNTVNSPSGKIVGDKFVGKDSAERAFAISVSDADVMFAGYLKQRGATVTGGKLSLASQA